MVAVLNVGSATFKWKLFEDDGAEVQKNDGEDTKEEFYALLKEDHKFSVIAHRVVHGGVKYVEPAHISKGLIKYLREISYLAPLHNPPAIDVIEETLRIAPHAQHLADFDTGFFRDLPIYTKLYGLPYEWHKKYNIQRFGFHGLSHEYAAHEAAKQLNRPVKMLKLITVHLGAGSSVAAIAGGKPIDTSMGFTPLEGLMMATRSGDIDPAIILYLLKTHKLTVQEIDHALHKESGLKGIAGEEDMRTLLTRSDTRTLLALDMFIHRIRKYIGAYMAILGGLDAIVMTGAIGAGSEYIRNRVTVGLDIFGDFQFLKVETNEEKMIFQHIQPCIKK
ncbi:MAG: acetate/propionate family kinase [bacterium]|nr:acetate/propionate family kinase [bacterium]